MSVAAAIPVSELSFFLRRDCRRDLDEDGVMLVGTTILGWCAFCLDVSSKRRWRMNERPHSSLLMELLTVAEDPTAEVLKLEGLGDYFASSLRVYLPFTARSFFVLIPISRRPLPRPVVFSSASMRDIHDADKYKSKHCHLYRTWRLAQSGREKPQVESFYRLLSRHSRCSRQRHGCTVPTLWLTCCQYGRPCGL